LQIDPDLTYESGKPIKVVVQYLLSLVRHLQIYKWTNL